VFLGDLQEVEGLLATTETEDEMEGRLLLDVVIGEGATIFELLSSEDQSLLIWGDSLCKESILDLFEK
jgi:hypothetical protein